jgi:hypothetical protein
MITSFLRTLRHTVKLPELEARMDVFAMAEDI